MFNISLCLIFNNNLNFLFYSYFIFTRSTAASSTLLAVAATVAAAPPQYKEEHTQFRIKSINLKIMILTHRQ